MLLYTPTYLFFLLFVFVIYWILPNRKGQKLFLVVASFAFYAFLDLRFAPLLLLLTVATYYIGKAIYRGQETKFWVWLGVLLNLSILLLFKYSNFFIDGVRTALSFAGLDFPLSSLNLLLPLGISFYTFQGISYIIEVYRRKIAPARGLIDFALYLDFFPKLIAGPIARPAQFFNQLEQPASKLSQGEFVRALGLLVLGLVKKVIIADSLAGMADVAFRAAGLSTDGSTFPAPLFIQGFYLYAFQIYADFSGYTDLARASAALLGFKLTENFQQPYLSSSLAVFWNRWHMSLTQWFREYLFFPLSRSLMRLFKRRNTRLVQVGVTLVTMTLIGLWHGAAWTFIAWGMWHGVMLSIEQGIGSSPSQRWKQILQGVVVFHLVGIGWVLFRSDSLQAAQSYIIGMFRFQQMGWVSHYLPAVILTAASVFAIDLACRYTLAERNVVMNKFRPTFVIAAFVLLMGMVILNVARGGGARPFIYGQF